MLFRVLLLQLTEHVANNFKLKESLKIMESLIQISGTETDVKAPFETGFVICWNVWQKIKIQITQLYTQYC